MSKKKVKIKTRDEQIHDEVEDLFAEAQDDYGVASGRCAACGAPAERGVCIECGNDARRG